MTDARNENGSGAPADAPLEQSLTRLEEIARVLEKGDLPLEDSLRLFEEGVALSRRLEARLAEAELKVETLLRGAGGDERVVPFEPSAEQPSNGPPPGVRHGTTQAREDET